MTSPPAHSFEVIAIDGPSGAGKTTVAKAVARRLGWRHLDTGSMYRAVTLYFLDNGVDVDDPAAVERALDELDLKLGESGRIWLDQREVTQALRRADVESAVSRVSALRAVRARMRELQRAQARSGPLVAEGRDMASVVFPEARHKFFIDADPEERARRRCGDLQGSGKPPDPRHVLAEIERRDRLDSSREDSPLVRVADAVYVDTTGRGIDEVVAEIVRRLGSGPTG